MLLGNFPRDKQSQHRGHLDLSRWALEKLQQTLLYENPVQAMNLGVL